jgi:hypothetical protein
MLKSESNHIITLLYGNSIQITINILTFTNHFTKQIAQYFVRNIVFKYRCPEKLLLERKYLLES